MRRLILASVLALTMLLSGASLAFATTGGCHYDANHRLVCYVTR